MAVVAKALRDRRSSAVTRQRQWSERSGPERAAMVTLSSIEFALTMIAAVDLYRRPGEGVRGPKPLWWPIIFVQPVGPVAYLAFGRRR
jgi:Phospholipase_D-nuclease N-terminal